MARDPVPPSGISHHPSFRKSIAQNALPVYPFAAFSCNFFIFFACALRVRINLACEAARLEPSPKLKPVWQNQADRAPVPKLPQPHS